MADRIIRAQAIISGKDEFGPAEKSVLEKIARINRALETAGKASGLAAEVDKVSSALAKAERQLGAIERFRGAQGGFAAARTRMREAQAQIEATSRALAAAEKPTKALEAAQAKAAAEVKRASAAFERQRTQLIDLKHELEGQGVALGQLAGEEARLKGAIDGTATALERQAAAMKKNSAEEAALIKRDAELVHQRRRFMEGAVAGGGAIGGAWLAGRAVANTARQGADLQHEIVRLEASGMSPEEIAEAKAASLRLSGQYRAFSPAEILHVLRNARAVVGNFHEAEAVADPLLKLRTVAIGAHPERAEELEADFDKLVKGMEIKGVTQNMPAFQRYMEGMAKAINVFGDTLRPTDYYEMFKYGRQSTAATSEEFMLSVAPTLAQELGGSSAGKALQNIYQHLVGGHMEQTAVQDLAKLGLVDPHKVSRTKTGAIKGILPGGVIGTNMPGGWDPYKWMNEVYLPALAKHGITAQNDIMAHIATDFGTGTATQVAAIFATQQSRIEKDRAQQRGAEGLSAADRFTSEDPKIAWREMTAQLDGLMQAMSGPKMAAAAAGLNALSKGIHGLTEAATAHPDIAFGAMAGAGAAGVGLAGYSVLRLLMAGPALTGAAGELTGAAAALSGAAAKLSAGGAAGAAQQAAGGAAGAAGKTAAGVGLFGGLGIAAGFLGVEEAYRFLWGKSFEQANDPDFHRRFSDPSEGGMLAAPPVVAAPGEAERKASGAPLAPKPPPGTSSPVPRPRFLDPSEGRVFDPAPLPSAPEGAPRFASYLAPARAPSEPLRRLDAVPPATPAQRALIDDTGYLATGKPLAAWAEKLVPDDAALAHRLALAGRYFTDGGPEAGPMPDWVGELLADRPAAGLYPAAAAPQPSPTPAIETGWIHDALAELKAMVARPAPVDVTGKLDPVELKGDATVRVQVSVKGPGEITDSHASSSGHVRVDLGTSMEGAIGGGSVY